MSKLMRYNHGTSSGLLERGEAALLVPISNTYKIWGCLQEGETILFAVQFAQPLDLMTCSETEQDGS